MARKKFKPLATTRGSGLLSKTHRVKTISGGTLELEAQLGKVRKGERNYELADAKRRILNRLPTQESKVRTLMLKGISRAEAAYMRFDKRRNRTTGELRVVEKSELGRQLEGVVRDTMRDAKDQILSNIEGSVKTYLIGLRRSLDDKSLLPMSTIRDMARKQAIQIYNKPTGKDGMNTAQRLATAGGRMELELLKRMDMGMLKRIEDRNKLKKSLVDPKGSNKACISKTITRINRTEQNRAMHKATVDTMASIGVSLFYWRLSAAHKDYGGTEICEVLSVSTGADVNSSLPSGFSSSTTGLYTSDSLPDLPHPNCMCSIEPVFV